MAQRISIRQDNAIDFWRGFALISIFINHIPGTVFERFTHRNFSPSDSAELFIFLAGWALRLGADAHYLRLAPGHLFRTFRQRASRIYGFHILTSAIALVLLMLAARWLHDSSLLGWLKAGPIFANPNALLGLAALTQHLSYFDILPLYVVLLLLTPPILLAHRNAPSLLLPASLAIYLAALVFRINVPQWPGPGDWTFNPLTWQFVFVLGFALASSEGVGGFARRHLATLRTLAWPVILIGAAVVITDRWPNPARLPDPKLLFMTQKTFATPIRVLDFLALAAVGSAYFPLIATWAPKLTKFFAMLGRNSLNVFCVGSCLSVAGQILRFAMPGGGMALDAVILGCGIVALGATAALSQDSQWLRRRFQRRAPARIVAGE